MDKQSYPRVEINLQYLGENVSAIVAMCETAGIDVAGVIKGVSGIPQCAKKFQEGGVKIIATSRLEQIENLRNFGIDLPYMLLRIPMISEVSEVIRLTDISLNSEVSVLRELNREAALQNRKHEVILMADLGDLREGFWQKEKIIEASIIVENELKNLDLAGVGTNLGCYGSVDATADKLSELVDIAEIIESKIARKLKYISGGATTSLPRIMFKDMPKRINLLRVGEGILLSKYLPIFFGYDFSFMHKDVFTLKAEVVEVKIKPSYPIGVISMDAFGHKPKYVDRGIRKRALVAVGKVDYNDVREITPRDEGIEIIGASSDHTILDIEDYIGQLKPGDILDFDVVYASLVFLTSSDNVKIVFI